MQRNIWRHTLTGITLFAAISAIVGGFGVISTNGLGMPLAWLENTPFADYVVPGYILLLIVGGSAFIAALLELARNSWSLAAAFVAGAIMTGWIIGEVIFIQQLSWLQAVYLVVGLAMMALSSWLERASFLQTHHFLPQRF